MELEFIKHSDISHEDLLRIINIKNVAWPHPIESQLKWISDNQGKDDFHVILNDGLKDYAYMDLCPVDAFVDGKRTSFMGIGNVCTVIKGQGYGGKLITLVNKYLDDNELRGLLFCMAPVAKFYLHFNWHIIPSDLITIECKEHNDVCVMTYNAPPNKKILYNDRLF